MAHFRQSAIVNVPARDLADWHWRRGALERMVPAWSGVRVARSLEELREGATAELRVPLGPSWSPVRARWVATHESVRPGESFADRMTRGPLRAWRHEHRFLPADDRPQPASTIDDAIDYALPRGVPASLVEGFVARELHRLFTWRHVRLRNDLRRAVELGGSPLTVAISGASGLVGRALSAFLSTCGHRVRRLTRGAADESRGDIAWDPVGGVVDERGLEACDAVVHLAGESIARRWNERRKRSILESRERGTATLARALARLARRPGVLVSASAVGYYGDRGAERVDERSPRGDGFLADVCEAWEAATQAATDAGVRVVRLRIGLVVARVGGPLAALLVPFSLGLGGPVGDGRQGMSWIALDDLCAAILFALRTPALEGPVNAVSPHPCSNREFARMLGEALRRPAFLPAPGFAVRAALGEMGRELLLGGAYVEPTRLAGLGFRFDFPALPEAFRFELGRMGTG